MITAKDRLYAVAARAGARRGVPMVLAVVDERGLPIPRATAESVIEQGSRLADASEEIMAQMCMGMSPDDEGAAINVLCVVADSTLAVKP